MHKGVPAMECLQRWADEETAAARAALPVEVRRQVESVPVVCDWEPAPELVADGVEPDTLGLFVGADFVHQTDGQGELPPQILLFLGPLWEESGRSERRFRVEVRRTIWHEIGHYLGWDESDLAARGLE